MWKRVLGGKLEVADKKPSRGRREGKGGDPSAQRIAWMQGGKEEPGFCWAPTAGK